MSQEATYGRRVEHRRPLRVLAAMAVAVLLSGCGAAAGSEPAAESPGSQPSTSASGAPRTSLSGSPSPKLPRLSGRPILGRAAPHWLGKRVLPETAGGFGEVRPTPSELKQRRFTLPDHVPPLPATVSMPT